jgi:putative spermidine/putrescine transport system substrate-binding protein
MFKRHPSFGGVPDFRLYLDQSEGKMKKALSIAALAAAASLVLAGCASGSTETSSGQQSAAGQNQTAGSADFGVCGNSFDELVESAKAEGTVNLIALPDSWANYKGILASFRDIYGINNPVQNPDASSADELTAIETLRGQSGMPEVVDVGPSFAQEMIDRGFAEVYKPTVWDEIPDALKHPEGYWVGAYYGLLAIATNSTLVENVPTTWADLKKPEYRGMVTLNGDPREAGAAFATVMAASLANGGSFDDIMPGIEYFAELKQLGNLNTVDVTPANLLSGEVVVALDWTYNFPGIQGDLEEAGFDFQVVVPTDGLYGGFYAQAVVTEAEHPCAARLWLEHLVGNDGALGYMEGGAIPARLGAMLEAGVVPDEIAKNLPPAELVEKIAFPNPDQVAQAKDVLTANWGPMVADK